MLFPFHEYWTLYLGFVGLVMALLLLDLGVFHRKAHEVSLKEAGAWSVVWIGLALLFNFALYRYVLASHPDAPHLAGQTALEFLTGYVIEKALAVDNVFVFIAVFGYFGVPRVYQHKVLFYGILGALVFRAAFIAAGAALMQYHWVLVAFGVFLALTGIKLLFAPDKPLDPGRNPVVRVARRLLPMTDGMQGGRFFVRRDGRLLATPLFLTLLFVEVSDVIFALDSVPAIFAVTKEPFVVFTSNIFAILGLRSLYFVLEGVMHRFHYLKYGLGLVLVFVGVKMAWLNDLWDGKFPILWSLGIIFGILAAAVVLSLAVGRKAAGAKPAEAPASPRADASKL